MRLVDLPVQLATVVALLSGCGKDYPPPQPPAPLPVTPPGDATAPQASADLAPVPAEIASKIELREVVHGLARPLRLGLFGEAVLVASRSSRNGASSAR
jgi:hypothetical protein